MSSSVGSRDYGRFDELAEEFAERYRRGERPSLQEYVDRLPAMADEIREMFPAMVAVERAEGDARGDTAPPPPVAPRLRQIGDYQILREVGRGGMGVVYEAEQVSLGRRVALKVLPGHAVGDRKTQERFRREAKAAARLHHTNIVPVFEVGRDRDVSFYAMQLIQGQGLEQVIDELRRLREPGRTANAPGPAGPAGPERPEASATVTEARFAASSGLRQRELGRMAELLLSGRMETEGLGSPVIDSPSAAGLDATERFDADASSARESGRTRTDHPLAAPASESSSSAVLPGGKHVSEVDASGRRQPYFRSVAQIGRQAAQGLAYAHARGVVHRDIKPSNLLLDTAGVVWITDFGLAKADDDGLTATGDILGTLRYMAPERFRGEGDARADIYALGLTLYELMTLRPAYGASDRLRLIEQVKSEEPARPRSVDSHIPRDLETIVLKASDKDPARRYPSAEALAEDLRRFLADEPIQARQISTTERYWRWAHRNPVVAALGAVLTAFLVMVTVGSLLTASRFADLAERQGNSAAAERSSRATAQAETYRAMLSEVRALRAGHQLGWRGDALGNLARLTTVPTPRRDLVELRNEAVASLGEFDVVEVARLEGSRNRLWSLNFSPDSRTLMTASVNGDLDLWDVARRRHSWQVADPAGIEKWTTRWPPPQDPYIHARFLPDGGIARTTWGRRVEFLDPSGRPSARPSIAGGEAPALGLEINRHGHRLAVGWKDGRINLHDADTGALLRHFGTLPGLSVFALSPDGRWLAHSGPDNAVQIQPTDEEGSPITLGRHRGGIKSLAFNPDGTTLASTSSDQTATLWDVARREERVTLRGHKEKVSDLAFSPDGDWVATTSDDYTARIWDVRTGQMLAVVPGSGFMQTVAFSPDGQYLAVDDKPVSGGAGAVRLYQLLGRRERRLLVGHVNGTQCLAFHPRLPRLASGADDHAVIVWDAESARPLLRWTAHPDFVSALAYSPDGSLLASGKGVPNKTGEVRIWDAETGSLRQVLSGHASGVYAVAFDDTGRRLATGDARGGLIIWDVNTGRILRQEIVGPSWVWSIAFVDGGRRLVTEVSHGPVVVYDLEGTDPPRRVAVPGGMRRFVVDRTRNDLIVAGKGGMLTRVSLRDLAVGHSLDKGHDGLIESLALSPSGRLLATGGGTDGRVVFRDAESFEPLLTLPAWTGMVKALAFDATGRWLAIAGAVSDVGLWDLDLVRDELAAVGLAWDQPAPAVASAAHLAAAGERPKPQVPVVTLGETDPAEFEAASRLVQSGVAAFRQGRFAAAVDDLQQASQRLQTLRESRPSDPFLARQHGISLGFLASSLRDSKRSGEALAQARAGLAAYESLYEPNPGDLYDMARDCALVSALDDQGSPDDREKIEARAVEYLRRAIEGDMAQVLPQVPANRDFAPLRARADFRDLMADPGFPRDPFAQPSPLSQSVSRKPGAEDANTRLARKDEGYALLAAGRTRDGLSLLAAASASDPGDTAFMLDVAALQAWFGKDAELAVTCRRALEAARDTKDPTTAERTAKACCLRPVGDKTRLDATLTLARQAVTLGKSDQDLLPWFQMVLGMAEYRSGHYPAADEALLAAANAGKADDAISGTSAFYRAMSLFQQGKEVEARRVATEAALRMKPLPASENNPLAGGASHDDLILWMAYKEAAALLKLTAPPASPARPGGQ